jgi:hypothetical protein
LLKEEVRIEHVRTVTAKGYAPDLKDVELEELGRDPFLVAYALPYITDRTIITTEVSKPSKKRANRHIPDVCNALGVLWGNTFKLTSELDFKTNWKRR